MSESPFTSGSYFFTPIPKRLSIPDRPEFSDFPYNVLFASHRHENGRDVFIHAVYLPVFESYKEDGDKLSMRYRNGFGGESWLTIEYNRSEKVFKGSKVVDGKEAAFAMGGSWNSFFQHFTMTGVSKGEKYEMFSN